MAVRRHNWIELKAAYARGQTASVEAFADAQKISRANVHDHARKEGWKAERDRVQFEIAERATKAVIREEAKAAVHEWKMGREEIDKIQHRAARNALAIAHNALAKLGDEKDPDPNAVGKWTDIVDVAADGARKSADYPISVRRIEVTGADGKPIMNGVVVLPAQTDE